MQQLYNSNDIVAATGCVKSTITLWASKGWIKPCRLTGDIPSRHEYFFTKAEYDRILEAVRAAEGHARKIFIFLNRTIHQAPVCNAVASRELAARCGCSFNTLRKAMATIHYPADTTIVVLEEDVDEVKAIVEKVRAEGRKNIREGQKARWRKRQLAGKKPESAGSITLHIKGLTISLSRKDAEALAEELLEQF